MKVEDVVRQIERRGRAYPQSALREAVARGDEIVPPLLEMLERALSEPNGVHHDDVGYLFALYILAKRRESKALDPLLRFARLPSHTLDNLFGDILTEDFPSLIASVCGTDVDPIKAVVEDSDIDEYARAEALHALTIVMLDGRLSRDELVAYHSYLLERGLERERAYVWSTLASASAAIHPGENLEALRSAFEAGYVAPEDLGWEHVEHSARLSVDEVLAYTRRRSRGLINDVVASTKWWASPKPPSPPARATVGNPKIGRNDSCPCGSGKKYKKCCWLKTLGVHGAKTRSKPNSTIPAPCPHRRELGT